MDQEKRLLLAFALSFVIVALWSMIFYKRPPAPVPAPVRTQTAPVEHAAPSPPPPKPVSLPVEQGSAAQEILVEGKLYRITFSTEGAVVKSWVLMNYKDEEEKDLDVVNRLACEKLGYPMQLRLADPSLTQKVNSALYVATQQEKFLKASGKLEFVYSDGKVQVRKQFSFGPSYEIHVEASVFDGQRYLPVEVTWPGGFGDYSLPAKAEEARSMAVYGAPEGLTTVSAAKIHEDRWIETPFELAGLEDRYFVDIFFPDAGGTQFHIGRQTWAPPEKEGKPTQMANPVEAGLKGVVPQPLGFRLFVAPKDLEILRSAKPPLENLVDFGWFSFVAKPLFLALRYIYERWIHNWGWAIIILTLFLNFAMFPLKMKSIKSAQEMQKVAPIIKDIQERYKRYKFNDPRKQQMNQEIMKIYKEHHINPLGGCLPMALQLPILYGFYRLLDLAIELRHAPWIWCIKDLSEPDKCYLFGIPLAILPTIMIITMFILQKMTPMTTVDPAQQRMMLVMPLVFGVLFYGLASGLVLYYLAANVIGIAQQMLINKMIPSAAPTPKGPPAGRPKPPVQKPVSVS